MDLILAYMETGLDMETTIVSFLIVFVIAAVIAWAYVRSLQSKMNNIKSEPTAHNYTVPNSFQLRSKQDKFLFSNVTRVAKSQNNGGGHHGGGGHRGGGGGGGHRGAGGPRGGGGGRR